MIALAPNPISVAKCITSRASAVSMTRAVRWRFFTRVRWWCSAEVVSSAGIGARFALTSRSVRMSIVYPASTRASASAHRASRAFSSPASPSAAANVMGITQERYPPDIQRAQLCHVIVGQDGMRKLHLPHVLGRLLQEVFLPAHVAHQRHDEVLAVRVDGRVGDLGELLLEIVVQELRPVGEHGEALVVAHGADGLLRVLHHGRDHHVDVFHGVAEHPVLLLE